MKILNMKFLTIVAITMCWALCAVAVDAAPPILDDIKPGARKPFEKCPCERCPCDRCDCDIAGIYHVRSEEDGRVFFGACIIEQFDDIVFLHYVVGPTATLGVGIRKGNSVAVAWQSGAGPDAGRGVTLYEIRGHTLEGRWTAVPPQKSNFERLQFLRRLKENDTSLETMPTAN